MHTRQSPTRDDLRSWLATPAPACAATETATMSPMAAIGTMLYRRPAYSALQLRLDMAAAINDALDAIGA